MFKIKKTRLLLLLTAGLVILPFAGCSTTQTVTQPVTTTQTVTGTSSSPGTVTVTGPTQTSTVTVTSTPPTTTATAPTFTQITITPTQPTTGTAPPTGSVANGQRIFDTATSSSGEPIYAEGYMMMYQYVACADCHGEDGHGQTIYMMMFQVDVPNITWPELTSDTPPFTVDSLKLAITQGIDPAGGYLSFYMPRWQMSTGDLNDLVSFVMTLT